MGKPPREALQTPKAPSASHVSAKHDRDRNNSCGGDTGGSAYDAAVQNSGPVLSAGTISLARDAVDGNPNSLTTGVDALPVDPITSDLFPALLPDFTSLEFGDGISSPRDPAPVSTLETPMLQSYTPQAAQIEISQTQLIESGDLDRASLPPALDSNGHDCSREAYRILSELSLHSLDDAQSLPESLSESRPPGSASTSTNTTNRVPLDHVLRLNREAGERLGRLLTCSCAASPHLALLYASIISQILVWYQQAAGCAQSTSWSPADITLDTASQSMSLTESWPSSGSGSGAGSSTWSSTAASTLNTGGATSTPTLGQVTGLAVTPAKMAIGTFNVDDSGIQTALKIQLLSGEMRRAGQLIDQFALHDSGVGHCLTTGEYTFGGVNSSLYQSLVAWLKSEHSRIASMMKSKLREFNM